MSLSLTFYTSYFVFSHILQLGQMCKLNYYVERHNTTIIMCFLEFLFDYVKITFFMLPVVFFTDL